MFIPTKRYSSALQSWTSEGTPKVSLDAAGLVALADLEVIAQRTAYTGTSALLDTLVLCPGLHRQQTAPDLNGGEYPAVAAMTSGYVFRVENPATVLYLKKVGKTGCLTTLHVTRQIPPSRTSSVFSKFFTHQNAVPLQTASYLTAPCLTIVVMVLLILSEDWWGVFVICALIFVRFCNVIVLRRRAEVGWKGASEPGVKGDLLALLSQDRWVRIKGDVDDLKAVTSGQWLRDMTFVERSVTACSTVLLYLDAALASNMKQTGKVMLIILLILSSGLLAIANEKTDHLQMYGRIIKADEGSPKQYGRRLELAEELVKETGRTDWAVRLGLINGSPEKGPIIA
ncbi:MAG: hypothetical protein M1821_006553 [Bathelium mastoideum]|nr:MAG: hypothetical protein M1821_006553 [Bathelium mastoideum]